MKKKLITITIALFSLIGWSFPINADNSFEELKKLEGKWVGTLAFATLLLQRTDATSCCLLMCSNVRCVLVKRRVEARVLPRFT